MISREDIYEIIEPRTTLTKASHAYNIFMMAVLIASVVPLMTKEPSSTFIGIDIFAGTVFVFDYILRWVTADFRTDREGPMAFVMHPVRAASIIDLVTILSAFPLLPQGLVALRLLRTIQTLRLFRLFRYSRNINILVKTLEMSKDSLIVVAVVAAAYVFLSALVLFNVEPDLFPNFLDALYWSVVTLTTIGYGDFIPQTPIGRVIVMLSAFFGVAVIALPTGILAASFAEEMRLQREEDEEAY